MKLATADLEGCTTGVWAINTWAIEGSQESWASDDTTASVGIGPVSAGQEVSPSQHRKVERLGR